MALGPGVLPRLVAALSSGPYIARAGTRRAAVALILRVSGFPAEHFVPAAPGPDATAAFLSTPAAAAADGSTVEVLYILRSSRVGDAWSGQVAFPGGKVDPTDASDAAAAIRETLEEVGIDLNAQTPVSKEGNECFAPAFVQLGRLDDRPVYAGGRARPDSALTVFVFAQTGAMSPPLLLNEAEVADARWVPLAFLADPRNTDPRGISRPLPVLTSLPGWLRSLLLLDRIHFPAVHLPPPAFGDLGWRLIPAPAPAVAASHASSTAGASAAAAGMHPPPARGLSTAAASAVTVPCPVPHGAASPPMQLWGMTATASGDLLRLLGHSRGLNWPSLRFRNPFLQGVVYAACGAAELLEAGKAAWDTLVSRGPRRPLRRRIQPGHALAFVGSVAIPVAAIVSALS